MVDYDELLRLAKIAFPIGTKYTGLIHEDLETSIKLPNINYSSTYGCKGIEVGVDWIWLEDLGWCKEFSIKEKHYELW